MFIFNGTNREGPNQSNFHERVASKKKKNREHALGLQNCIRINQMFWKNVFKIDDAKVVTGPL